MGKLQAIIGIETSHAATNVDDINDFNEFHIFFRYLVNTISHW